MTTTRGHIAKAGTVTVAAMEAGARIFFCARTRIDRFHTMIRTRAYGDLWIADAGPSLIASFASGITKDHAAVHATVTQLWSNGQIEGQITKLKLVSATYTAGRSVKPKVARRITY